MPHTLLAQEVHGDLALIFARQKVLCKYLYPSLLSLHILLLLPWPFRLQLLSSMCENWWKLCMQIQF